MSASDDDVVEAVLLQCWGSVLRRTEIGVHDNFFALGGHSLTAMKIVHRLRTAFGVELDYALVLESLTVAALAKNLRAAAGSDSELDGKARAYLLAQGDGGVRAAPGPLGPRTSE